MKKPVKEPFNQQIEKLKKYILICFCFFAIQNTQAQDPTIVDLKKITESVIKRDLADSIPKTWSKGVDFSLNISQSALNNWSAGGDDFSFSLNSYLNLFAFYTKNKNWDSSFCPKKESSLRPYALALWPC
jgi:hypothetical protein